MPDWEAVAPHEPDHIVAVQHGGQTELDNLSYACFDCNRVKGSNIASVDPASGRIMPLFHPRHQQWGQHFRWSGAVIEPLTATGRATVFFLRFNDAVQIEIRGNLQRQGRF
jgi:HNH endonuclease